MRWYLTSILFYKTGQIQATEFIETDENHILLQKGDKVIAKDFIENQSSYDMFELSSSCSPSFTFGGVACRPANRPTDTTVANGILIGYQGGGTSSTSSNINIMSTNNQIPADTKSVTVSIGGTDYYFLTCTAAYVFRNSNTEEVASFEATSTGNMSHTFTGVSGCHLYVYINVPSGVNINRGFLYPTVTVNSESGISYNKDYSISCNEFVEE